jgi:hypothetical protein
MKNNTLAMLATISLVFSVATLIGYVDPAVCAGSQIQDLETCTQEAANHLWAFAGFFGFGAVTLIAGTIRTKLAQ